MKHAERKPITWDIIKRPLRVATFCTNLYFKHLLHVCEDVGSHSCSQLTHWNVDAHKDPISSANSTWCLCCSLGNMATIKGQIDPRCQIRLWLFPGSNTKGYIPDLYCRSLCRDSFIASASVSVMLVGTVFKEKSTEPIYTKLDRPNLWHFGVDVCVCRAEAEQWLFWCVSPSSPGKRAAGNWLICHLNYFRLITSKRMGLKQETSSSSSSSSQSDLSIIPQQHSMPASNMGWPAACGLTQP